MAPKKAAPSSRPYGSKKQVIKPVDSTITLKPDIPSDILKDSDKLTMEAFTPDTSFGASHLVSRAFFEVCGLCWRNQIDLIKPAPGVTIKEGEVIRKGEPVVSQKVSPISSFEFP